MGRHVKTIWKSHPELNSSWRTFGFTISYRLRAASNLLWCPSAGAGRSCSVQKWACWWWFWWLAALHSSLREGSLDLPATEDSTSTLCWTSELLAIFPDRRALMGHESSELVLMWHSCDTDTACNFLKAKKEAYFDFKKLKAWMTLDFRTKCTNCPWIKAFFKKLYVQMLLCQR